MGYTKDLLKRQEKLGRPVYVGVVGAGQMGSGMVSIIQKVPGLSVAVIADHTADKAVSAFHEAGRDDIVVAGLDVALATQSITDGKAVVITDGLLMPQLPVDIVVEVSGVPDVAAQIAYTCITHAKDVAMMTIEADITVGPLLAQMANAGNSIYTVMRGDEPIEAFKLVEYAEDLGLEVICAGKGKNNVNIPHSVPEDNIEQAKRQKMNPRMLTEFTDGTKTQIEMTALSNATGMPIEVDGMYGKQIMLKDLATQLIPEKDGGILKFDKGAVIEYVTGDVAPGVFAIVKSDSQVVIDELDYLKLGHGPYYVFYRPWHIASIEAHLSIGEAILNRRADFQTTHVTTEVVGRTKAELPAGTTLDAMGTHHYYGWAIPAERARELNAVPIGLLKHSVLKVDKAVDEIITYDDIEIDETRPLVAMRRLQDSLVASGVLG